MGAPVAVYERWGNTWVQTQSLPNPSGIDGQSYGRTLGLDGDFLAVGSHTNGSLGYAAGAVHIYERENGVWSLFDTLYAPVPGPDDEFGVSLDLDGAWLAVGTSSDLGIVKVHTYVRTFAQWEHAAELTIAGGLTTSPVAIREMPEDLTARLLVGHPQGDDQGVNTGAATLYTIAPNGVHAQDIPQPFLQDYDAFGWEVALGGDLLAISALWADGGGSDTGAVYLYDVGPEVELPDISLVAELNPCGGVQDGAFGASLAVTEDGQRVAIGAPAYETPGEPGGAVHVWGPDAFGSWIVHDTIVALGGVEHDLLGTSVALEGNALLAGARGASLGSPDSGAAYFVSLASSALTGGECPCESLAQKSTFGAGKPGSDGIPELSLNRELVPGESTLLLLKDVLVGGQPFLAWGLVPAEIPFDDGTFLIGDPHFLALPTVGVLGQVGSQLNVPDESFLCGVTVYLQALLIDPSAGGTFSTAQSNGLQATIGY